jgi:cystathionine beta-lyase
LQWVDFSEYGISDVQKFLTDNAKVYLSDGAYFGGTDKHARINFACPRSRLAEALDRIEEAVKRK